MLYVVIGGLILGMVLVALLSMSAGPSGLFAENYSLLLGAALLAVVAFAVLIAYQLYTIWRRKRSGLFGARLAARMFWAFGLMALLPGLVVYGVSVQFLISSIESWFDVRMEQALDSGIALGQSAIGNLETSLVQKAETMATQLADQPKALHKGLLDELREAMGVQEAALFTGDGRLLAYSSADKLSLVPRQPERTALWQARLQQPWSRTEQDSDGRLLTVRALVPVNVVSLTEDLRYLQVTQPASSKLAQDAQSVEHAQREYQELAISRLGLKRLYGVSLTLALALSLFSALALAFILSERLAAPLRALARGTRAVARGDFSQVNAAPTHDELGLLTQSFNRMTQQLSEARSVAQRNHDMLLDAKAYLEGILGSVSTGVVTLDHHLRVRLVNPAAAAILGSERDELTDKDFAEWGEGDSGLRQFALAMREHFLEAGSQPWREQVEFPHSAGARILFVQGTPLITGESTDYALVLDDVTQLVRAQRDAAWGEVARRLAHEIKNPLTPIQLSAERLQVKLTDQLNDSGRRVLGRATETIVGQVAALKGLVDAFAHYARMPAANIQDLELNTLLQDVVALYEHHLPIRLDLADALPRAAGDPALLRQVLVNLIKNAEESLAETDGASILLRTHPAANGVTMCVEDNGPGFPESLMNRLFEPYATTKPKGTGLGLAIVRKIVEEHHGSIEVRNLVPHGASVCITLPIMENVDE